ncbi:hypothetical protein DXG03_005834 [Asterophora parasitica]|uniref:Uncharacterized protein n=1 Tax=Asterophora parasitica TaxID=117018 RepID=A0A9P7G9R4_9AGAR|nr:hypothetical protein DXG03_005834 [Asterophora parasitica]
MSDDDPPLLALKHQEETASNAREAMRPKMLPGREPPSADLSTPQPVAPLASDSQLLPTHPEALQYPNKTLEPVPTTAVIDGLTTDEREQQRAEDAFYCAEHFPGHVVLSPLNIVLARLGTPALFTQNDPPPITSNPLIGASEHVTKYQQTIINADDILSFIPTLSLHGKGEDTKLFFSILSQVRPEFAVIDQCFNSDLFRVASFYQLGYNTLFVYTFCTAPLEFFIGNIVPVSFVLPGIEGVVRLTGRCLSRLRSRPFERSIVVLEGTLDDRSTDTIYIVVKLLASFAAFGSPPPGLSNEVSRTGKRLVSAIEDLPAVVRRHLEVMPFSSPPNACQLMDVGSGATFLAAAQAILDAFRRGILHRDLSVNDILVANDQLLLDDWEIGRRFRSWAGNGKIKSLAHWTQLESTVCSLVKVLTQRFVPPLDQKRKWATILRRYHWDDRLMSHGTLRDVRFALWVPQWEDTLVADTLGVFRLAGHHAQAQLLSSLFLLPLPTMLINVDANHDTVLRSLEVLVKQAVEVVDAVDVNSFSSEWDMVPNSP